MAIAFTFSFSTAFAGMNYDYDGEWVYYDGPEPFTVYKGERCVIEFSMYDTWENYYTIPSVSIANSKDSILAINVEQSDDLVAPVNDWADYTYSTAFNSKNRPVGNYSAILMALPCDEFGWIEDDFEDFDLPFIQVNFKLKQLGKTSIKSLKTGKKSVKIKYSKVTGATKYQIYRSTKKGSGYKKIATVKGTSYTNKGLKKGKKYYYKVRALRYKGADYGTAYGSYSTAKRSGKVK